jgi:hypothetical protein
MRHDQPAQPTVAVAWEVYSPNLMGSEKGLVLWADPLVSTASAGAMVPRVNHDPVIECHGVAVSLHHEVGNEKRLPLIVNISCMVS